MALIFLMFCDIIERLELLQRRGMFDFRVKKMAQVHFRFGLCTNSLLAKLWRFWKINPRGLRCNSWRGWIFWRRGKNQQFLFARQKNWARGGISSLGVLWTFGDFGRRRKLERSAV